MIVWGVTIGENMRVGEKDGKFKEWEGERENCDNIITEIDMIDKSKE